MTQAAVNIVQEILNPPQAAPVPQAAEPVKPASPTESAVPQPVSDPRVSGKLSVLAQRERQAMDRENAAKAKEAEISAKLARIEEFEGLKKTNPLKALELLGLSYEELSQIKLADGSIPPEVQVKRVEDRLNDFERRQLADRDAEAEAERQSALEQERVALETFQTEIAKFIEEKADKYPLIRFEEAEKLVFDVIDEHYNRTVDPKTGIGKIMTKEEAADKVEAHFKTKYEKAPDTIRNLLIPAQTKLPDKLKEFLPQKPPRTLTNNQSATPMVKKAKALTDDERIRQVVAEFQARRP